MTTHDAHRTAFRLLVVLAGGLLAAGPACAANIPSTLPGLAEPGAAATPPPQVKDDLFAGTEKFAQGATDVTDVNLDQNMLDSLGSGHGRSADAASRMHFIVVHSYTYDRPGMYNMDEVEAYQKKLASGDWNCFIHVRERKSGESTDMCSRHGNDENNELVIITAEPKELTFVHLSGQVPLSQLSTMGMVGRMAGSMGTMAPNALLNMAAPPRPKALPAPAPPPADPR